MSGTVVGHDLVKHRLTCALGALVVIDDELARLAIVVEHAVQLRHDVARDHVPAPERVLAIGPVVDEVDQRAEAAGELLLARLLHQVVGRADDCGRASITTAPAIAPMAAAVTPSTNAVSAGSLPYFLKYGAGMIVNR